MTAEAYGVGASDHLQNSFRGPSAVVVDHGIWIHKDRQTRRHCHKHRPKALSVAFVWEQEHPRNYCDDLAKRHDATLRCSKVIILSTEKHGYIAISVIENRKPTHDYISSGQNLWMPPPTKFRTSFLSVSVGAGGRKCYQLKCRNPPTPHSYLTSLHTIGLSCTV